MSLPLPWIDKIFTKLTLIYGRDFIGRWEGLEIADVKTDWAHEMSGFDQWPEAISFALSNLPPSKPPTVYEFRELCRKAPAKPMAMLPSPKANPDRVAAELAKLAPSRSRPVADMKDWARRIISRHEAGEKIRPLNLRFAREALGMKQVEAM